MGENKAGASTAALRMAPIMPWIFTANSWVYTVLKIMDDNACNNAAHVA